MSGTPVLAGASFAAGLRTEFLNTYNRRYDGVREGISAVMKSGIPAERETETFFYWESAPHIKRWRLGENMSDKPFRGVSFTASVLEWAESITWRFTSRQDDQTKSLQNQARQLGQSAALLDERVFFQIVQGATDNNLLSTVPTAPDGQALYATTDGTGTRFGISNGNLLTGAGIAAASDIRGDFFDAMSQFRRFQDTEGQPLWDNSTLDGGATIYYGAVNEEVFRTAFEQKTVALAASTATSNAGISNIIMDSGYRVRLVSTQRITDNDWYIFLNTAEPKAVFSIERQGIQDVVETFENSDSTRRTGLESIRFWLRRGYGVGVPFATIKINN